MMEFLSWLLVISSVLLGLHKIIATFYAGSVDKGFHEDIRYSYIDSSEVDSMKISKKHDYNEKRVIQAFDTGEKGSQDKEITCSSIFGFSHLIWSYIVINLLELYNKVTITGNAREINFDQRFSTETTMTSHRSLNLLVFIVIILSVARTTQNFMSSSNFAKKFYSADLTSLQLQFFNKTNFEDASCTLLKRSKVKIGFNYDWMYPPLGKFKVHLNNTTCNNLKLMEIQRLASYRSLPVSDLPHSVSVLVLASAGFGYTGRHDLVRCDYCGNEVNIQSFVSDNSMLDPKKPQFHQTQCISLKNEVDDNGDESTAVTGCVISKNETAQSSKENVMQIPSDDTPMSQCSRFTLELDMARPSVDENRPKTVTNEHIYKGLINKEEETKGAENISTPTLIAAADSSQLKRLQVTPSDDGYVSDDPHFVDSHHFNQECAFLTNGKHTSSENFRQPIRNFECDKNPGHFAYLPMLSLKLEQLPGRLRHKDFMSFLQLFSLLTVRVVVNVTSSIRHWTDPAVKEKGNNCRTGTGWVSFDDFSRSAKETFPTSHAHGKWKTVKKYMKTLVKKNERRVYIETNRHIVIDSHEAENSTVEFFYDDPSRRGVKVVKCVAVHLSGQPGDNRAILECKTGDYEFLQRLQEIRQKLKEMVEVLPRKIKSLMCKTLFILHHPHGREKHLSYGDSVLIKYSLETTQDGKYRMVKVNNQTSEGDLRKVLLYAADTCQGTSGAPVIGFQKGQMDANGMPTYLLNVWIHNGEEKFNNLGGTAMKELLPEDHQLFLSPSQQSEANEAESDTEAEEATLGKEPVCAPSLTVIAPPTYLKYASFDERVNSFLGVLITLIHSPVYFATAGFFYADYGDCVRCFQCGLGLRSWKPGDNVYEQHQKHRPDCQYLQAQLKNGIPTADDHWLSENVQSNESQSVKTPSDKCETYDTYETESETIYNVRPMESPAKQCMTIDPGMTLDTDELTHSENEDATITEETNDRKLAMNLLLSENEKLKSTLLCKVCHKEPVKDLFLPCGELYACSDCSKLLTHCPSCNHQIMATVTTYLT